jgi:penicillin-binding protein 1A
MVLSKKGRIAVRIYITIACIFSLGFGVGLGIALGMTANADVRRDFGETQAALPSQILDRDGRLITEFFSDEKRDIIPITEIPKHFITALLSREDKTFFDHFGLSVQGLARAAWNIAIGSYHSGASTLTQLVAGNKYCDRTEITVRRKFIELWWAFQVEKSLSKYEILEIALNSFYLGHNAYGVEAASQFYFGHSVREISLAEAVLLVIQYANPSGRYSPYKNPERARMMQQEILNQMVENGYVRKDMAERSFHAYWSTYDWSRSNIASAYFDNQSKAPYFSEYVRQQLGEMLYGSVDINKDGYIVHTTLDLEYQQAADEIMRKHTIDINRKYSATSTGNQELAGNTYIPTIDLLSLAFNLPELRASGAQRKKESLRIYTQQINPSLDLLSLMFGAADINKMAYAGYQDEAEKIKRNTVEGALITLENNTGYILAMVGGSEFETRKYNRAVDAKVQPGSSFKPLYYSQAISSGMFTAATRIPDMPIVFYVDGQPPYAPENYKGEWMGSVLLRYALAKSMNVPSLQVLDAIGFEAAIERASRLLGMSEYKDNPKIFPRTYPLGLGTLPVAPINMARAFATFPNQGREVVPLAITSVEDRNGNIILEPEKERLRARQRTKEEDQILSPQAAYVMTSILQSTVEFGTLWWPSQLVGGYGEMPLAGKTGTTQNWRDIWTVGFSPYMTTAVWFGFDYPGNSLGITLTGSTAAGPCWAEYMRDVHAGLEPKEFQKPETGLVTVEICRKSGLLPTELCRTESGTREEIFIAGTEPRTFCDIHPWEQEQNEILVQKVKDAMIIQKAQTNLFIPQDLPMPDFLKTDEEQYGTGSTGTTRVRPGMPFDLDSIGEQDTEENVNPLLD